MNLGRGGDDDDDGDEAPRCRSMEGRGRGGGDNHKPSIKEYNKNWIKIRDRKREVGRVVVRWFEASGR